MPRWCIDAEFISIVKDKGLPDLSQRVQSSLQPSLLQSSYTEIALEASSIMTKILCVI